MMRDMRTRVFTLGLAAVILIVASACAPQSQAQVQAPVASTVSNLADCHPTLFGEATAAHACFHDERAFTIRCDAHAKTFLLAVPEHIALGLNRRFFECCLRKIGIRHLIKHRATANRVRLRRNVFALSLLCGFRATTGLPRIRAKRASLRKRMESRMQ